MPESALYVERIEQAQERLERLLAEYQADDPPRSCHGRRAVDLCCPPPPSRHWEARPRKRAVHDPSTTR